MAFIIDNQPQRSNAGAAQNHRHHIMIQPRIKFIKPDRGMTRVVFQQQDKFIPRMIITMQRPTDEVLIDKPVHVTGFHRRDINGAKEKGTYLVMDIYNGDYIDEVGRKENWPEDYLRKNTETTDVQRQAFRKVVKAGVKIAYGSDAGVYPIGTNAKQFTHMVKFGMTPMQAIQSATVVAADLLNWQEDVGAVSAGRYADMIAVDGDPVADISILEALPVVMKGGAIVPADLSIGQ